ncbi:prolyl 3-hydroxylase 1-like isoform X2 [Lineus longissimus]|uniref:prolyl 3-hydroxylase 1-like isoform X2 n=1 Tax=Lineus longissimus TaxID=88925 RepID=UPI00315D33FE
MAPSREFYLLSKTSFELIIVGLCAVFLLPKCLASSRAPVQNPDITFETLYTEGKDAYYEERWAECVSFVLKSLEDYKFYRRNLAHCRLSCRAQTGSLVKKKRKDIGDNLDMLFFYGAVQNSDCNRRCHKKLFGRRREVTDQETLKAFETLEPYNYLQLCFFRLGNIKQAASSAYTFYLANRDHEIMLKNIHNYRKMDGIKDSDFVSFEEENHVELFLKGVAAHEEGDWLEEIDLMEKGLQAFYAAHEECDVLCEGPFDHKGSADFYSAIADHYINVLKCKEKCPVKLSTIYGKYTADHLSNYYHYLQYAYFQAGDIHSASHCVGTYLMYKPRDQTMLVNKKLYMTLGMTAETFKPRDDAIKYHTGKSHEAEVIKMVESGHYMSGHTDVDDGVLSDIDFEPVPVGDKVHNLGRAFLGDGNGNGARYKNGNGGFEGFMDYLTKEQGVTITDRLDENERLMGDDLLKETECGELIDAAMIGGFAREGEREHLRNKPYPISFPREIIQFIRADRATDVLKIGKLKKKAVELYLNTAHLVKDIAENYYNLTDKNLYFRDLRLLCRKIYNAIPDTLPIEKLEEVCFLQEDGLCQSEGSWDGVDYHGVVYLNDQHVGGTVDYFIPGGGIKKVVNPSCGKFVLHSPKKNVHNVHAITNGSRCVMSMAMTMEKDLRDIAVMKAEYQLREYEYLQSTPKNTHYSDGMMEFYRSRGISVSLKPEDLHGEERFVADGLADNKQCDMLVKLAQSHSSTGDGYHEGNLGTIRRPDMKQSPHTIHETFQGLTVDRAAQLAQEHVVDADAVRMYMNLSELAKEITEHYFKLDTPLYFDFTHLVCRTAVNDENKNRSDLSHPVHSDNCLLQPDGTCRKELPAYIQRDYSALLYLNGDFEGGEFIFTDNQLKVVSEVKPACGRVVGFNAGDLHGVKAVLKGRRCAIAMWYTLDPFYQEVAHAQAKKTLNSIKGEEKPEGPAKNDDGGEPSQDKGVKESRKDRGEEGPSLNHGGEL